MKNVFQSALNCNDPRMKTFIIFICCLLVLEVSGRTLKDAEREIPEINDEHSPSSLNETNTFNSQESPTTTLLAENLPTVEESQSSCSCDWRYFKHYETKGCTPVFENGCNCPSRFNCPDAEVPPEATHECKFKDRVYKDGEKIETLNPCEICTCRPNIFRSAISCIPVECPHQHSEDGCYEVYEANSCCAVRVECDSLKPSSETGTFCEFEGKPYHAGQRIYSEEDPCVSCFCDESWTGIAGNSCHNHDCLLERKIKDLREGCIPIYHEKTCCPIEFHCGNDEAGITNDTVDIKSGDEVESKESCSFKGRHYAVGEVLDIKHPTNCVTCKCTTPPDFTCIHKSCQPPPNYDYENCRSTYNEGECCPTYNCKQLSAIQCAPVQCSDDCKEVIGRDGCSSCLCSKLLCSPPNCPDGCDINYDVPETVCPSCSCQDSIETRDIECAPVKCSVNCREVTLSEGCPSCLCGQVLCSPPNCQDGCEIDYSVSDGECPSCSCPDSSLPAIQCAPVKCSEECREVSGPNGCPTCLCSKVLCSPPNCPDGCEINYDGVCPSCSCPQSTLLPAIQCAPVKCSDDCREVSGRDGCSTCQCSKILCSPPNCQDGCEIDYDVPEGSCPSCSCPQPTLLPVLQCSPVKCSEDCREVTLPENCPSCVCDKILCSPPKCEDGCEIDYNVPADKCPACSCPPSYSLPEIQCSPVQCSDDCKEVIGLNGCSSCQCNKILCSPPKCPDGCEIDYNVPDGKCPGCKCPE